MAISSSQYRHPLQSGKIRDLSSTVIGVFPTTGTLKCLNVINTSGADAYVQLFDALAGNVTLGTTAPDMELYVPAGLAAHLDLSADGRGLAVALAAASTTLAGGSVGSASGVQAWLSYAAPTPSSGQFTCATPVFTPAAGNYSSSQMVTITAPTLGAAIYYTLDGSTPTTSSTLYTGPITVAVSETIKTIAVLNLYLNSSVASAAYVLQAATPSFSPTAGTYSSTQTVTITSTSGSTIWYTVDGSTPAVGGGGTTASISSGSSISVATSETVKAIAALSGYSNSAQGSAAYIISPPPTLYSLAFNGGTQYVDMGNPAALQITGQLSFSAWVRPAAQSTMAVGGRWISGAGDYLIYLSAGGAINWLTSGGVGAASGGSWSSGSLYHIVGTWDGTNMNLYINGSSVASTTFAGPILNLTTDFTIGKATDGVGPFNGTIDAVRVYNTALTSPQVTSLYGAGVGLAGDTTPTSAASLVGKWGFDEGSGSTAIDSSTSGNNGTLVNSPTYGTALILG